MTTRIAVIKRNGAFWPVDAAGQEELATIPENSEGIVRFTRPRNLRQFRLAWALATKIAQAKHDLLSKRQVMDVLLEETGHFDVWWHPTTGEVRKQVHSISFGSMKQADFDEFFKRAVRFTLEELLPGVKESELKREINIMVGAETIEDNLTENDRG